MAKVATSTERLNQLFDSDPHNDSEIAEMLGVSKQTISAWRSGIRSPKRKTMSLISERFHVSELWLYGWDVLDPVNVNLEPEADSQLDEYVHLFVSLTPEKQKEVIRYIRFLLLSENE